jgi:hypothetical protein
MNIGISLEIDIEAQKKSVLINDLSETLKMFFLSRYYGEGILNFYIGCICIKTKPGYEEWYKIRKPRYKNLTLIKDVGRVGNNVEIKNSFSIDMKIDNEEYNNFISSSDIESKRILASEILKSLSNLDALPKRVKDFDKEQFKADMEKFFKEQGLIEQ